MIPPWAILGFVAAYFGLLIGIAAWTSRGVTSDGYFLGNRRIPWWLLAFGLIGDTLSGVTFLSVPGNVGTARFTYLPLVFGYVIGYLLISGVLLPVYYRLRLVSIYGYLGSRFDPVTQKTGAGFFLLSRTLGAAARLYLAVSVFQEFVFKPIGIPFAVTAAGVVLLIYFYTVRGGIQTLVWTDLMQSGFLVLALVLSVMGLIRGLDLDLSGLAGLVRESPLSEIWVSDWKSPANGWKQVLGGALIALVMTGLDQNCMQRNLACRSLSEAQRNIHVFIPIMLVANVLFVLLGLLLHTYATKSGIAVPPKSDLLFPTLAWGHLGTLAAIAFTVGLAAATFNSADSVLTTLTTSFCVDFLNWENRPEWTETDRSRVRGRVHAAFAVILLAVIFFLYLRQTGTVISLVLRLATFTYGPLLGLFALGLSTRIRAGGWPVAVICLMAPFASWYLESQSPGWLNGYRLGNELLLVNGIITAIGVAMVGSWRRPHRTGGMESV